MSKYTGAEAGCLLVAEYLDEGQISEAFTHLKNRTPSNSEIIQPLPAANYLDVWHRDDSGKEFKILLCDRRVIMVRGHYLKFLKNDANPSDKGSYGIVLRDGDHEALVALFPVVEVQGVFSGDLVLSA